VEHPPWTRFILKDCSPQRTPARAAHEGLQPVGRTHDGAGRSVRRKEQQRGTVTS